MKNPPNALLSDPGLYSILETDDQGVWFAVTNGLDTHRILLAPTTPTDSWRLEKRNCKIEAYLTSRKRKKTPS